MHLLVPDALGHFHSGRASLFKLLHSGVSVVQNCDPQTAYLVLERGAYSERTLGNPADNHVDLAL